MIVVASFSSNRVTKILLILFAIASFLPLAAHSLAHEELLEVFLVYAVPPWVFEEIEGESWKYGVFNSGGSHYLVK